MNRPHLPSTNEQQQIDMLTQATNYMEFTRAKIEAYARRQTLLDLEAEITRMGRTPLEAITMAMEANGLHTLSLRNYPTGK